MTPLFKLPVTGGSLIGTVLPDRTKDKVVEVYHKRTIDGHMAPIEISTWDSLIGKKTVIGSLSDVTEEMAKEWGFRSGDHMTWDVMNKLNEAGISDGDQDFSKILVILIKDE